MEVYNNNDIRHSPLYVVVCKIEAASRCHGQRPFVWLRWTSTFVARRFFFIYYYYFFCKKDSYLTVRFRHLAVNLPTWSSIPFFFSFFLFYYRNKKIVKSWKKKKKKRKKKRKHQKWLDWAINRFASIRQQTTTIRQQLFNLEIQIWKWCRKR